MVTLQQGAICLDTLGTGWSPVGTIKMALISLRMLLESPNPKDPQDAEVAKMMMEQPNEFAYKAHEWAVKYAGAPRRELLTHNYQKPPAPVVKNDPSRYVCGDWMNVTAGMWGEVGGRFKASGFC